MPAFVEDLEAYMEHFSVPVLIDGAPCDTRGIEDFADVGHLGHDGRAEVIGRQRTLLLKTTDASPLRVGSKVTVNGTSRTVLNPRAVEDGVFTTVTLR